MFYTKSIPQRRRLSEWTIILLPSLLKKLHVCCLGAFSLLSHHVLYAGIDKACTALNPQKEREHEEVRKKKRENNEKKHKKKEDKKARAGTVPQEHHISLEHAEHVHKKRKYDSRGNLPREKNGDCKQAGKCRAEQLEGSGLSEEHGLPCFIPEPCESSESTQNSSKNRKLEDTCPAPRSQGGTILRFKLPLKKHNDSEPVPSRALPGFTLPLKKHKDLELVPTNALPGIESASVPSSALPGSKLLPKKLKNTEPVPTSALPGLKYNDTLVVPLCTENKVPEYAPCNEKPCFSGRTNEASRQKEAAGEAGRSHHSSSRSSKRRRKSEEIESQLRDLLSSLNPAPMQYSEICDDDQGWLFGSAQRQCKDPSVSSCGADTVAEGVGCESSALSYQPVACFMPEFDCYRLPYAIPY